MKRMSIPIFLFLVLPHVAFSQEEKDSTYFYPFVSIGYPYVSMGDLKDYYNSIVDNYRSQGVPIQTQVGFGRTVVIGGGILYNWGKVTRLGLSLGYWYSPAYSGYEDYGGSLKVNGSLSDLDVCLMMQSTVEQIGRFPIDLEIRAGATRSSVLITQQVRYNDFPEDNTYSKFSETCWGPCFEITLGSRVQLGRVVVSLEGGYRITSNKLPEIPSSGIGSESHEFNISESAVVFLLSIGTRL